MTSWTSSTSRSPPWSAARTARCSLSALYSVDDADELLGADLPHGTWDTVGGLMLDLAGRVPDAGDSVEIDGFRLTAVDVRGRRIGRVRIEATGPPATDGDGDGDGGGERAGGANHNGH